MSTSDSDISAMMQHLDAARANRDPEQDEGCSNCRKPVHKRKVKQIDIGDGRSARGHHEVKLKRVCPECGAEVPRIRSGSSVISGGEKKIEAIYNSNTGAIHLCQDAESNTAECGWSGGTRKEIRVNEADICGECRAAR
ncbi:hypothetical protein NP511_17795 [Natrinema thermotolerans]|uniref:Uncharacterized protein n=1 Tax=Natrinema thermotolerans TaxID=121872 RepID=A0AAF0PEJ7_9EURY|nr:hypothetical protein [Natrinema thermotolerans]QCC60213.1 hypothetical protein DVR14_16885 [Natrinema thermotolerans]QCC61123.1 hypothetical protein DVR14_21005 [Natrinema thermotolerans]WMT07228.1 hypothetical protein NP511_17795 [Natrinema thermotolerans]